MKEPTQELRECVDHFNAVLFKNLPKPFYRNVSSWRMHDREYIQITIAVSDVDINRVPGQKPQRIDFTFSLQNNQLTIGGSAFGGMSLYRKPNKEDPTEKHLAMVRIKVPFRKPKATKFHASKALERFIETYIETIRDNVELLMYQDIVDYPKLFIIE